MMSSEQKLTVKITNLNIVIVSNMHTPVICPETHQRHHLYEFTAQGTCAHQESV